MKTNNRTLYLLILLLLVGAAAYPFIRNLVGEMEGTEGAPVASEQLSDILGNINNIKMDISALNGPELAELVDFTLPLLNIPIGRSNPFAK
jgi:hypothetical protein